MNTGDITSISYFSCWEVYCFKPDSSISNINQAILFKATEVKVFGTIVKYHRSYKSKVHFTPKVLKPTRKRL